MTPLFVPADPATDQAADGCAVALQALALAADIHAAGAAAFGAHELSPRPAQ